MVTGFFLPSILDVDKRSDTGKMWTLATWTGEQAQSGAVHGHPAAHRPGYIVRTDLPRSLGGDMEVWKTWGYGDWKPGKRDKQGK